MPGCIISHGKTGRGLLFTAQASIGSMADRERELVFSMETHRMIKQEVEGCRRSDGEEPEIKEARVQMVSNNKLLQTRYSVSCDLKSSPHPFSFLLFLPPLLLSLLLFRRCR